MTTSLQEAIAVSLTELATRTLVPVDVAVIDSGVDATHPALAGRVASARRIEQGEPVELTVPENNDTYGHGTGVASIIARVAPNARIVDIRVLQPGNKGSADDLVVGLRTAVRARVAVINMSLAAPTKSAPRLQPLCERAFYQDQVIVAARRNMPFGDEGIPAEFASVLGVGRGALPQPIALQFNPRKTIELDAPGDNIPVAAAGGGYTEMTGTSFATPMVSAVCALLLGAFPGLRPHEIRTILCAHGIGPWQTPSL